MLRLIPNSIMGNEGLWYLIEALGVSATLFMPKQLYFTQWFIYNLMHNDASMARCGRGSCMTKNT